MVTPSIRLPIAVTSRFYIGVGLFIALMAAVGFWPTYFGPLLRGTLQTVPVIHFHATVYSGWLLLFIVQIVFASTGRLALHRKLGKVGIYYGFGLVVVGVFTALSRFASRVQAARLEEVPLTLAPIAPLSTMIVFPLYRRKPEIHKRLMIVATTILLIAAVSRMTFLGTPVPLPVFLVVWFLPIFLAMGYDFITQRLIHPVYVIGLVGLFILRLRNYVGETDAWSDISRWMATFVS